MGRYRNWEDLRNRVAKDQVIGVELQDLKDLQGVKRLGANVLREIANVLDAARITYFPDWVLDHNGEPRQNQQVWLTPAEDTNVVHKVVRAVQAPDRAGVAPLLRLLDDDSGWSQVEELKDRLANVRAALEDAMDSLGDETD